MASFPDTCIEQFKKTAREFSDKPAIIFLGETFSYGRFYEAVEKLAGSLHEVGISRGDKAVLYLPNCPQWVMAWFALLRIGAVAIPVSPIYTACHP